MTSIKIIVLILSLNNKKIKGILMEKNAIELPEITHDQDNNITNDINHDQTSSSRHELIKEKNIPVQESSNNNITSHNNISNNNSEIQIELQNINPQNDEQAKFKKVNNDTVKTNQKKEEENKTKPPSRCTTMPSCLRHLDIIRERKLSVQVGIVYTVFMIVFIIAIGLAKIVQINSLLETQADKNYYTSIVSDMIDIQREVKIQLDSVNNDDYTSSMFNSLLFFRIYTEELLQHKLIFVEGGKTNGMTFMKDSISSTTNPDIDSLFEKVGDGFKFHKKLEDLMKFDFYIGTGLEFENYNIHSLIPFYYTFMPILYQNLKLQGIPIVNAYFLVSPTVNVDETCKTNYNLYFKYPLEKAEIDSTVSPTNDQPYDFILDPVGRCSINLIKAVETDSTQEKTKELEEKVKKLNWYYNLEEKNIMNSTLSSESKRINSEMLSLLRVTQDNQKEEYFMNYINFKIDNYGIDNNNPPLYFTIAMKILRTDMDWPYLQLDSNGDIKKFNYISLMNFELDSPKVPINLKDKVYNVDYNIDDNKTIIVNLPKFIDNIYKYTMLPIELVDNNDTDDDQSDDVTININSLMLKYSEMGIMKQNYSINYYYEHDTNFFKLLLFLNNFLVYFNKNPGDILDQSLSFHPCLLDDIEDYYASISEFANCFDDYCFYNNCNMSSKLYVQPEKSNFMPDCYCLPLYCRDDYSLKNFSFHMNITEKLGLANTSNEYAYTSKKEENNANIYYNNLLHEYYNEEKNQFKCKISFNQKSESANKTFNTKIMLQPMSFDSSTTMMIMFLMSNDEIYNIVTKFKNLVNDIKWIIYLVYFLFLTIVAVFLIAYLIHQVNCLTERMTKMKEIRSKIISGSNGSEKQRNSIRLNNDDKKEIDNLLDKNDININVEGSVGSNSKEENKEDEADELSALKTLINENINDFKIEFNINENMNDSISVIEKQYNEIIKVNGYKNKLLPNNKKENNEINIDEELDSLNIDNELRSSIDSNNIKEQKEVVPSVDDLSLKIFYELLSLSTNEIDFSKTKTNFYFKDDFSKSILNFDDIINSIEAKDNSNTSEITNPEKLENAIRYYKNEIHTYWKEQYDIQKKKDEI